MSSILVHGYIPKVITESVIVLPTLGTTLCPCVLYPGAWVYTLCPLSLCMGIYLVSSILVHGYIPTVTTESVVVPVIKDKNRHVNGKGNYRPICLSNIGSEVVEAVLLNRMDVYLQTTPHQFGFKSNHGTELCVFTFKELLRFYTKHGSAVHVVFLDASKAFDRVNRWAWSNIYLVMMVTRK